MDILGLVIGIVGIVITIIGIIIGFPAFRDYLKEKLYPKIKFLTPNYYLQENPNFIDRSYIFREIQAKLKKNNILLIYGIGGIGKSSIAIEYINRKKWLFDFKHRYFLAIDSGIEEAFKSLLLDKTKDINLNIILDEIDNRDTLLILDNALTSGMEELTKVLNQLTKAKVIVTSRSNHLNIANKIEIEPLSERESLELFESYFGRVKDENIKKIVTLGNKTPLVLEILAKHTKYYLDTKTPKEILEIFENSKNDNGARIDLGTRGVESTKSLIEGIFNINEIDTNEKKAIMLALANLDPNGVEVKYLLKWLHVESETEYLNAIDELLNLGWINKKDGFLKTHRVVIEVIKENIKDEKVINTLFTSLGNEVSLGDNKNPIYLLEFIPHSLELLRSEFKNETYTILSHQLSHLFRNLGNCNEALKYALLFLEIKEKFNIDEKNISIGYSNISRIYSDLKDYKKAIEFSKKAINIKERINDKENLAISYSDLSLIYLDLKQLDEAIELQNKSIEIKEKVLDKLHPELATSYNNISGIYEKKGNFKKALGYQLKAIDIREKSLDKFDLRLALSYYNIVIIYYYLKKYKIAKEYINKSIYIYKNAFPNGHQYLDRALDRKKLIEAKL